MKIPEISRELLSRARDGELAALDAVLITVQPAIFNLAMRMLGHREDAQDACQEILLKITTHLGSFRGESTFGTWAWRVATNHLLSARSTAHQSPEVSFEALQEKLAMGVALVDGVGYERTLLPEEKLDARRVAVSCTQGMLMALDQEHRMAYILDVVFGLPSEVAADVLQIDSGAYRKRLSRARQRLQVFMSGTCSLVGEHAQCSCDKQVQAIRIVSRAGAQHNSSKLDVQTEELRTAEREFGDLVRMSDAAAVFRGHPEYQAPAALIQAIRAVLASYNNRTQ